ncbi:MAG: LysR family transcriptional regulator [Alphaproteobacteria bacterium]
MTEWHWDDLRVFLTLAREGSLTASARELDVSHPTVSRRIRALEDAFSTRLFDRLPDRFVLTAAGEELLADALEMERAAETVDRRSATLSDTAKGTVRVSAGEAMAGFIAAHLPEVRENLQCVEIELVSSHLLANLSRREADLLIREQVPDSANLITRRLGTVGYAVYGAKALVRRAVADGMKTVPWAGFDEEHTYMPGQKWLLDLLDGSRPVIRVNDWLVLRDIARSGAALTVLPCHIGDTDPSLTRFGETLPDVATDQWLLVHRDLRALPRIRGVMDALIRLFQNHRPTIEGLRNYNEDAEAGP